MAPKKPIIPEKMDKRDIEVINVPLLRENPLMMSQVITPSQEIEQKVEMITEIESTTSLMKQQLSVRRQKLEIEVDNKKLDIAKKTATTLEKLIDIISDQDVLDRVKDNVKTAMDMKMLAEAAEKTSNTLKNLMNPSSQDEFGGRKRTKVMAQFQTATGEKMSIGVETSND